MHIPELDELKHIDIFSIFMNPHQPRNEFKAEEIEELAESIRSVGILHPPLVRPVANGYELISGERRVRAARLSGLNIIPVYIRNVTSSLSAQAALIENIQRVDLNPLDIARSLKYLIDSFQINQEQLSQKIGKKRSTVANYLRLLSLPEDIQKSLEKENITMGHAKAILALQSTIQQEKLHLLILNKRLNVREAELAARQILQKASTEIQQSLTFDAHLNHLTTRLREKSGTKVSIHAKGEGGALSFEYYNLEDLHRLLAIFNLEEETL